MEGDNELGSLLRQKRTINQAPKPKTMIVIKLLLAIAALTLTLMLAHRNKKDDPVHHCSLYKDEGCAHVDGPLCDYPHCTMLKEYLLKKQWDQGAQLGIKEIDRFSPQQVVEIEKAYNQKK